MFFSRSSLFALIAIASLTVSVDGLDATCPSKDKSGGTLANSAPADSDGLITCTYAGAPGACQYFAVSARFYLKQIPFTDIPLFRSLVERGRSVIWFKRLS